LEVCSCICFTEFCCCIECRRRLTGCWNLMFSRETSISSSRIYFLVNPKNIKSNVSFVYRRRSITLPTTKYMSPFSMISSLSKQNKCTPISTWFPSPFTDDAIDIEHQGWLFGPLGWFHSGRQHCYKLQSWYLFMFASSKKYLDKNPRFWSPDGLAMSLFSVRLLSHPIRNLSALDWEACPIGKNKCKENKNY
jgi:hypothetical protein